VKEDLPKRPLGRIIGFFKFSRMDLAVTLFIFAGFGAAFISAMGSVAMGYDSHPGNIHAIISHAAMLLFFPAFLVALLQRRWALLPLWICCSAILAPAFVHPRELFAENSINGVLGLLGVVFLTEAARVIRGKKPEK
jgi:hypothetical protein